IYAGVLPKDITILPDMKGKGWVKNLSYAMAEDNDLKQLIKSFIANSKSDLADLYSQANEILARWTHTDDIDPDKARGKQYILNHNYTNPKIKGVFRVYAKAREVAILENFAGKKFQMKVDGKTTNKVSSGKTAWAVRIKYNYLRDTLVINLLSQSLFGKDVYNLKTAKLKKNTMTLLQNKLLSPANTNEQQTAANLFSSFLNRDHLAIFNKLDPQVLNNTAISNMLNNNGVSLSVVNSNEVSGTILDKQFGTNADDTLSGSPTLYGKKGNDTLIGSSGHDVLFGGKGDDVLKGGHGSDILYGGDGNDTIIAGGHYGHDILEGGEGNDTLKGNTRASTYVYKYGHGHDIISDSGSIGKTPDVLILNGLARNNIKLEKQGNDLILKIRAYPKLDSYKFGSVLIKDCFGKGRIERFQFKDQTLNFNQLLSN
ncbi:MAG: calcium-binding protein, partial [Desulfobacteraceae bacterium]|nr:calcium-binding protein [Desulfobacteraceae bacterium]